LRENRRANFFLSFGRATALRGDIKSLVDDLEGFHRLRVGSNRVIFEYEVIGGKRTVTCVFAGPRK